MRRDVIRYSNKRRSHPDPEVAAAAERWARAVLRPAWWNRIPPFVLPLLSVVLMGGGWVSGNLFLGWWCGVGGFVALVLGLVSWNQRQAAKQILESSNDVTRH
ncbi:hypothetical protein GCM10028790_41290 [Micromonospora taraxaci]